MHPAALACVEALGPAPVEALSRLQERVELPGGGVAVRASPVSDMRSFTPEPGDDEAELLAGVTDRRLVFGHTHLQFRRTAQGPDGPVELVNPGSVGIPLDGDHRAAWALVAPNGSVELRRVAYDHAASAAALRERYGDAEWVAIVTGRIERARLKPD